MAMRLLTLSMCILLCGFAAPQVQAYFWYLGDTQPGGSWGQQFLLTNVGTFDYMRVDLISVPGQSELEAPAFRDFTQGGWADLGTTAVFSEASGPEVTQLYFDLWFTLTPDAGVTFRFSAYDEVNGEMVWRDAALADYDNGWTIRPLDESQWDPSGTVEPVPEPTTIALLAPGVAYLLLSKGRRKKEQA